MPYPPLLFLLLKILQLQVFFALLPLQVLFALLSLLF